jgi:hypothetical protein
MDPYLERPDRWSGVHAGLSAVLREILTRRVAPGFFVDSEDNVYILDTRDPGRSAVRPDVYLVDAGQSAGSARALGRAAAPMLLDLPAEVEVRAPYLRIVDTANRQVVTTIEVLSLVNKVLGSAGLRDFLHKPTQVLRSDTHWLEIDLLRAGARLADVPQSGAYVVLLHRAGSSRLEGWVAGLRDWLPTIGVPLRPPLADVVVDLQEVFESVYDRYRYDAAIDCDDDPPEPALQQAETLWLQDRVTAWKQSRSH